MKAAFCTFSSPGSVAGPNVWLLRLLPDLRRRGIAARAIVWADAAPDEPTIAALRAAGVPCTVLVGPHHTEAAVDWVLRNLAADPPDVFVPNLLVPGFFAARWARVAGIPTVGVMHSEDQFHQALVDEFVFGLAEYRLAALVCVSRFLEGFANERGKTTPVGHDVPRSNADVPPDRPTLLRRIPCGVPRADRLAQAARPDEPFRLVYMGRLCEEAKRVSLLTTGLCRAAREIPGVEATLYGDGPSRRSVERILATHGQGLPVRLGGRLEAAQVYDRLSDAHALVLLSDYEGLPIAVMEGMAVGLTPICTNIRGGVAELVENYATGLLVDDRGDGFVAAVRALRERPDLWAALSSAARQRIESGYASDQCADAWAELLTDLAASSGPQRPIELPAPGSLALLLPPRRQNLERAEQRAPRGLECVMRPIRRLVRLPRHLAGKTVRAWGTGRS